MKLFGAGFVAERTFSRSRRSRGGLSIVGTSQGRPSETTGNLIIGYDPAVGIEPLLAAASDYRAEILHRYTIINAVAVKPPANTDPQQAVRHFKTVRGVLSVEPDRVMQLHAQQ